MREKRPQSKIVKTAPIPSDLVDFLRYAHEMIEADDELATIKSDDLLQSECAYGGLIEEGGNTYGVTYFPEKGVDPKWELEFDVFDIADIAQGVKTELSLWKCNNSECRWMFSHRTGTCFHCDYVNVPD